ncbi:FAD-binding oxidoreductase [Paraburkholderia pallida]|nr:FAD-linked oxidase C-terminal domain-containing protein [Paraburkholderia pallida]
MTDLASVQQAIHDLGAAGLSVLTSRGEREQRGKDQTFLPAHASDAVVFAESTDDVVKIVNICRTHRCPITPFGAGTSSEGHIAALHGGICIDLTRMNAVLQVNADDFDCVVQAGITRESLNRYLRDTGLFFPIDACPEASIGGMVSTRASGTHAVRYGTMRENVINVTAVLIDGRVVKTANRARKSAAAYDLTRLFVGSAGTLGIITEVTVRLHPVPDHVAAAVCAFPTIGDAARLVIEASQAGVCFAKVEFMDTVQIAWTNAYSKTNLAPKPHLFFEFDGPPQAVKEHAAIVEELAREHGASPLQWAIDAAERAHLWRARHEAIYACFAGRPGCQAWATDVTVPISRLADCIEETQRDLQELPFPVPILGHVGDGNFHLAFMIDPARPEEYEMAHDVYDRMVRRAIAMDGTCTGEHGVGYFKNRYLVEEFGEDTLSMMRDIKRALDPMNLLNPGKLFDAI